MFNIFSTQEMQVKTTLRFHLDTVRMAKTKIKPNQPNHKPTKQKLQKLNDYKC